jgi:MFS family permease
MGLRSVVAALLAFSWLPWHLFAIRSVHGFSESLRDPAINALLAQHGRKRVASAFAWYSTAKTVAGSSGQAAAGIILGLTAGDFAPVFLAAFVLSSLPLYVVARYVEDGRKGPGTQPASSAGSAKVPSTAEASPRPKLTPVIILGFLMSGTANMLRGIFPVLATEYAGLTTTQSGLILAAGTLVALFSGPLFGWISDNVSREYVLAVRGAANVLSSVIYLVAPNFAGIAAAKLTDDMGKAAFRPAWGALMAGVSAHDPDRRGRTMSLVTLGDDAGDIAGPVLAGLLWSTWGVAALLGTRIALALVTEGYAIYISRSLCLYEPSMRSHPAPLLERLKRRLRPQYAEPPSRSGP